MSQMIEIVGSLRSLSASAENQADSLITEANEADVILLKQQLREMSDLAAQLQALLDITTKTDPEPRRTLSQATVDAIVADLKVTQKSSPIIAQTFNNEYFRSLAQPEVRVTIAAALIELFDNRGAISLPIWKEAIARQGYLD